VHYRRLSLHHMVSVSENGLAHFCVAAMHCPFVRCRRAHVPCVCVVVYACVQEVEVQESGSSEIVFDDLGSMETKLL
jgi:hypothetical protein